MISGPRTSWHTWCILFLVLLAGSVATHAEKPSYPQRTTEVLLSAQPQKWRKIEFVRVLRENQAISYRWVVHNAARDRRGPGAFTKSSRCILHAPARTVVVKKETRDQFEIEISLEGYEKRSVIRITASRRTPDVPTAWVTISGNGEIYEEFAAALSSVQRTADELIWPENRTLNASKGPGRLLRWFLTPPIAKRP